MERIYYYDCFVAEDDGNEYWTINLLNVNNGDNIQLFELEDSMQVWGPSASHSGDYLLLDLYDSKTDSVTILLVDFNQGSTRFNRRKWIEYQ